MVEPNFDGGHEKAYESEGASKDNQHGGSIGFIRMSGVDQETGEIKHPHLGEEAIEAYMQGIQGELLDHFKNADGQFGTVEGQMRNLVELLRVDPQSKGRADIGEGDPIAQFEQAGQVLESVGLTTHSAGARYVCVGSESRAVYGGHRAQSADSQCVQH